MTEGTPAGAGKGPLRIGTTERTAAMKALDEHLEAGRLGVEEYADRSAVAANATVASELEGLFTDLPEPHPALPGPAPSPAPAAAPPPTARLPVVHESRTVAERGNTFLDVVAPRLMAVVPFVAIALFFTVGGWWWFLLIPAAGALLYGSRHDDDEDRERDERRRERRERRRPR